MESSERETSGELFGSKKRASIKIFCWAAGLAFAFALVSSALRDMNLREEILKLAVPEMPEVTIENIDFEREMFGAHWKVTAANLQRHEGVIQLLSFDASRETDSGDLARITSTRAVYIESADIVELPDGGEITWVVSHD